MKKIIATSLLALFVVSVSAMAGNVLVDFTPTVGERVDGTGYSGGQVPFSMEVARNPELGASGYGGDNAVFYGGVGATGSAAINLHKVESDKSVRFRLSGASAGDSAAGVYLWKKENFLNGMDAVNVSLKPRDAIIVRVRKFGAGIAGEVRFVIQEGDKMYISANAGAIPASYGRVYIPNPAKAKWFEYTPEETSVQTIGAAAKPTFQNITAIGVYLEMRKKDGGGNITVAFDDFRAKGTPVAP